MAHCPSVNSQLIRCAADPNMARRQKASYTLYHHERLGLNVRHITTHFTWQGNGRQISVNTKPNKPPRRGNLLRPILSVTPMKYTLVLIHQCKDLAVVKRRVWIDGVMRFLMYEA